MKLGVGLAILNNFKGAVETLQSVVSLEGHDVQTYIMPQWRENLPLAQAWNELADMAFADGCDYVLISNDDVIYGPECLDNMASEMQRLKDDKVVMVSSNNIIGQLPDPYLILAYQCPSDPPSIADHPNFSAFMIGPDYFDRVGRFDQNFKPCWWEDNDAHYRANLLGYRLVVSTICPSVHFGGVSTSLMASRDDSVSSSYYRAKWGSANRNGKETFINPYGDAKLSPKEWTPNYHV